MEWMEVISHAVKGARSGSTPWVRLLSDLFPLPQCIIAATIWYMVWCSTWEWGMTWKSHPPTVP